MVVHRRSVHDREILRLALPALGALAVEPLYVLAGDAPYLAAAMAAASFLVFAPAAALVLALDGSLMWLWVVICLFMTARLAGNVLRFAGGGWQVTGAVRSA